MILIRVLKGRLPDLTLVLPYVGKDNFSLDNSAVDSDVNACQCYSAMLSWKF